MRFPRTAALGAVGAIAFGAVAVPALAVPQDEDNITTELEVRQEADSAAPEAEDRASARTSHLAEALAAELDLPIDEVEAALEAVHEQFRDERREQRLTALEQRLNSAVEDGSLTQEQADAILEAAEQGIFQGGQLRDRGPGHVPGRGGPRGWGDRDVTGDDTADDSTA